MTTTGQGTSGQGAEVPNGMPQASGGLQATGRLVDSHPLLARLTGQVVWNLAEEAGADDDECGLFMDHYLRAPIRTLLRGCPRSPSAAIAGPNTWKRRKWPWPVRTCHQRDCGHRPTGCAVRAARCRCC